KIFYLMLLPCLIHYTVFSYWPMAGNILAFKEFGFNNGMFGGDWVGFKYFEQFFNDPRSMLYVRNTLVISSMKLFLYLPFPIMLALMFNEVKQPRLRDTLQTVTYLPYFISWVVVVGLMNALLAPNTGLLNQVIANLDRKSTRLNSSHVSISHAVFCLKKKQHKTINPLRLYE